MVTFVTFQVGHFHTFFYDKIWLFLFHSQLFLKKNHISLLIICCFFTVPNLNYLINPSAVTLFNFHTTMLYEIKYSLKMIQKKKCCSMTSLWPSHEQVGWSMIQGLKGCVWNTRTPSSIELVLVHKCSASCSIHSTTTMKRVMLAYLIDSLCWMSFYDDDEERCWPILSMVYVGCPLFPFDCIFHLSIGDVFFSHWYGLSIVCKRM